MFSTILKPKKVEKNYPPDVLAIHKAFEEAGVTLVKEHEEYLANLPEVNTEKASRLAKLGFRKTVDTVKVKEVKEGKEEAEKQIKLVGYYTHKYPFNKFITESQVKAICNRWNLVCGDVGDFKGFVPEANLRDIENFNVDKDDRVEKSGFGLFGSIWDLEYQRDMYQHAMLMGARQSHGKTDRGISLSPAKWKEPEKEYESLKICAPIKDMETSNRRIVDGYKIEHIPDPVVLQPVKGGYLIITAWGDEASDPDVVNERFN